MRARSLQSTIDQLCFADHKIALVSGPRQCGKTTLAKRMLSARGAGAYFNWDQLEFRRRWASSPQSVVDVERRGRVPLIVLAEIHKARLWKRTLKGIVDTLERPTDLFVTGSARLAVYRKGSDSLLGRYRSFRLHPFSIAELLGHPLPAPDAALAELFAEKPRASSRRAGELLEALMEYGPFPEPLLRQDSRRARLWRRERVGAVLREDLRDLSRIVELDRVERLASLLPGRVGSLLSVESLRNDLEVNHETAQRWLVALSELYYCHLVRPFTTRVRRSVRKAGKLYLWDFGEVPDAGARFENLVAAHLLKACHAWSDAGYGDFELCCLRNRDGKEIDFLVTRDGAAWLPVEAKLSERQLAPAWRTFLPDLDCDRALQIVRTAGVREEHRWGRARVLVVSAADAFAGWV